MPYAAGGRADVANIQLRCRAHNAFEADRFFTCDAVRERGPDYGDELGPGPSSCQLKGGETVFTTGLRTRVWRAMWGNEGGRAHRAEEVQSTAGHRPELIDSDRGEA